MNDKYVLVSVLVYKDGPNITGTITSGRVHMT